MLLMYLRCFPHWKAKKPQNEMKNVYRHFSIQYLRLHSIEASFNDIIEVSQMLG